MVKTIPYALLAWGAAFTFAFMWCADAAYRATVRKALLTLSGIELNAKFVHWAPFGFMGRLATSIDNLFNNGLASTERVLVYSVTRAAEPFVLLAGVVLAIALSLWELQQWALHSLTHSITKTVTHTIVKPIKNTVTVVKGTTAVVTKQLFARVKALEHRVARLAHVGAGAIAAPFPRLGRLEKSAKAQGKRITRLEKLLAGGLGVAVVLRALSKLGLGWLRCGNVSKAGKAVCGMNPALLEQLLLDAALLTVAFNLEEFAEEMQTVTDEAAGLIRRWAA